MHSCQRTIAQQIGDIMDKVKILSVGVGGYANIYLGKLLFEENPAFEIVGAVDPFAKNAKFYSDIVAKGIPVYDTMDDFYNEGKTADLAVITTPIHFHTRQILTAIEHGANVMCEKPLSGVSADAKLIEDAAAAAGKWVMIGYQWSYSDAIQALKDDICKGILGKPVFLKTMILWPRNKDYFNRGTGWAGKLLAPDGTVINDSVAANATAHYLHNMLFVCGEKYFACEAKNVKADLIRVNDIENFDNATISFDIDGGAKCLFIAAHSTKINKNPIFEYRFENATVVYSEDTKNIVATFNDGTVKEYGYPDAANNASKVYQAIEGCRSSDFRPVCSPYTAAAHTRTIEEVQKNKIHTLKPEYVKVEGALSYIDGFDALLRRCYDEEIMLRDTKEFGEMVADND